MTFKLGFHRSLSRPDRLATLVALFVGATAFTSGCGGTDSSSASTTQGATGGSLSSGGAPDRTGGSSGTGATSASGGLGGALGGSGGGGASGSSSGGGPGGTGASAGAGGAATGGQPNTMCTALGAAGYASLKNCQTDSDCEIVPTYSCCGPGTIYGFAKSAESMYAGCLQTSPPSGCPPLGCASEGRTEDEQPVQGADAEDLTTVLARCVDTPGGAKQCYTTVKGSCADGATRCSAGDTCTNDCAEPCTCQDGFQKCTRPTGACPATPKSCSYSMPDGTAIQTCYCSTASASWSCSP